MTSSAPVALDERRAERRQVGTHLRRTGDLDPGDERGEVTLDCGHWVQQERPDEVTRLLDWLARHGRA